MGSPDTLALPKSARFWRCISSGHCADLIPSVSYCQIAVIFRKCARIRATARKAKTISARGRIIRGAQRTCVCVVENAVFATSNSDDRRQPKDQSQMSESANPSRNSSFDYVTLRLLMGLIAIAIPIVVTYLAQPVTLESISASYHTKAQDAFVGMLFIVSAFMLAYRGHSPTQGFFSKLGAVAAALVAVFPTSTKTKPDLDSGSIHYSAAAVLFLVLAFFCYVFWKATHASGEPMERRRSPFYMVCGIVIVVAIAVIAIANWFIPEVADRYRLTFWWEWIALWAFGAAWIVSGKYLPYLSKPDERPNLFADVEAILPKHRK